jgi:DNA invertase Pin-like site-specific DNA recombinase
MARASFQSMSRRIPRGNPKTAIAYLRVSTDEQALGPAAQRAAIERWAATQGVTVLAWHCDQGVSGAAALDKRPGLTAALGAVTEHGAGLLVVAKRDRLARDVVLAAMIESLAKRTGARVVSAAGEGEGDDGDPASLLMRRMVDVFAEYERAIIRARTRSALAVKRGRGERTGEIPFGLRLAADGVHFEPAAAERAVVARVRHLRAEGLSFRAIVASCDREGLVARTGRPLSKTQVERIVARAA